MVDAAYSVLVEFATLAGNVSSNTTFGKQISMCCERIAKESLQKFSLRVSHSNCKVVQTVLQERLIFHAKKWC